MGKNTQVALTRRTPNALMKVEQMERPITPVADIYETGDAYVVKLDMPGTVREQISISIQPSAMTIRAVVEPYHGPQANLIFNEIPRKSYYREFHLGEGIDHNAIEARYEEGVLTITLNKLASFRSKTISIT